MCKDKKGISDEELKELLEKNEAQQDALKKILKGIEKQEQSKESGSLVQKKKS